MFKAPSISIRVNVLTVILAVSGLVAAVLLMSQYHFSQKMAIESTQKTFELISKNLSEYARTGDSNTRNTLAAKSHNSELLEPITFNPIHPALEELIEVLQAQPNRYAIYFAHDNGHFYEVINMKSDPSLFQVYDAAVQTAWTVITDIGDQQQRAFLNAKLELISKSIGPEKYAPRSRPWYIEAIKSKDVIRTQPYLFSELNQAGVTYAMQLEKQGTVLALDLTLTKLNKFLALQKIDEKSEVFIVSPNGKKLASSDFLNKKQSLPPVKDTEQAKIVFSKQEQDYIKNSPRLLVSNENDWPPFDFAEAGEPKGYSIDLLRLLSIKTGLKMQFSNGYQWSDIMTMFHDKELDIVHSLYKTKEREQIGVFSKPIYSFKNYFIVAKDAKEIKRLADIQDQTIAVVKGWVADSFMQNNYPNMSTLIVNNVEEAFLAVSQGKADLMIDTKESFNYQQHRLSIENLKISGWSKKFDNNQINHIYMMLQKDEPILQSILNKALASLTEKERQSLYQKWFNDNEVKSGNVTLDPELMKAVIDKKTNVVLEYFKGEQQHHYFAMLAQLNDDSYLGIKIDADALLQPYKENIQLSLLIAIVLLLLIVPIVFIGTNYIVKPIRELIIENEKINNRQFNDVKKIKTHIVELDHLSDSLVSLSNSVQSHEKIQQDLLDAMIKLIAEAIDEKSPYTGGHCNRVPQIAFLLIDEATKSNEGIFKDFSFTDADEIREFEIGAWLHDCGKVTTPEFVVDKATKLETIYNRINEIRMRFEVLWRDTEIAYLNKNISLEEMQTKQNDLVKDFEFIADANIGGEFMDEEKQERVKAIGQQEWQRHFSDRLGLSEIEKERFNGSSDEILPVQEKLLSDKANHIVKRTNFDHEAYRAQGFKLTVPEHLYNYGEIYNLCISRGTLSDEERFKINEHIIMSIKMLEKIPFPDNMQNIPEYAGTHHETLIGTGYPRKLSKDDLSIPARIMAIADIYEALTASDRPYKKAKTLSESIKIMSFMVKDQHIDADLFSLFLSSGVYKVYAEKYLEPAQIDEVDITPYLT